MKYDLVAEVYVPNQACQVVHFDVWDRFGDKTLNESDVLADKCQN
jgi:hypothetical protein